MKRALFVVASLSLVVSLTAHEPITAAPPPQQDESLDDLPEFDVTRLEPVEKPSAGVHNQMTPSVSASPTPPPPLRVAGVEGDVVVEVTGEDLPTDQVVASAGGTVVTRAPGILLVRLPSRRVTDLAAAAPAASVREPVDLRAALSSGTPRAGTGGASAVAFAKQWHDAGLNGTGVSVGLISFFDTTVLATQVNAGEVLPLPAARQRCFNLGGACPFGTPGIAQGNELLEILTDVAPAATMYAAEVGTMADYYAAIDWMAANGVRILHNSLVFPYDGPGNGTGPAAAVVDYAVGKGIAWFNPVGLTGRDAPTGSYEGKYWRGTWSDPNGDRWLNFTSGDQALGAYCGTLMGLRWSDWGASRTDYELWVGDFIGTTGAARNPVLASDANQATGGAQPLEANDLRWLCNTDPVDGPVYDTNGDGFVNLWVRRSTRSTAASATGDILEILVLGGWLEHSVDLGSAAVPFADSANLGMATVSASGLPSGRGPTNDGRIKPDISYYGCVGTSLSGDCDLQGNSGYWGTNPATATAAAHAALTLDAFNTAAPWQVVQYLKNTARFEAISPGADRTHVPNNYVGHGTMLQTAPPRFLQYPDLRFTGQPTTRLFDSRKLRQLRPDLQPMSPYSSYSFDMSAANVPGVAILALIVTAVQPQRAGYIQLGGFGDFLPGATASLNVSAAGQNVANLVMVPIGQRDNITIFNTAGGHVVVDVVGSFAETQFGHLFTETDPYRVFDTRCSGCAALAPATPVEIDVLGTGNPTVANAFVPTTALSVMLSVTADSPTGYGFLSVVPQGTPAPMPVATLSLVTGRTTTGTVIVSTGRNSLTDPPPKVRLYASVGTNVQVDVLGYFDRTAAGGFYRPVSPTRVVNTREPAGSPKPTASTITPVTLPGLPATATAAFVNAAIVQPAGIGSARFDRGPADSNPYRHVSMNGEGAVSVGTLAALSNATTNLSTSVDAHRIVDLYGWFTGSADRMPAGWVTSLASTEPQGALYTPHVSADGDTVAFTTFAKLVPEDTTPYTDVYVWRRSTGQLTRFAANPGATAVIGVSDNGNRVAFVGRFPGIVADHDGTQDDMFIADLTTQQVTRINNGPSGQRFEVGEWRGYAATPALDRIFVKTLDPLVAADTNGERDLYRVDVATGQALLLPPSIFPADRHRSRDGNLVWTGTGWWTAPGTSAPSSPAGWEPVDVRPDGQKAVMLRITGENKTYALVDLPTGAVTPLCSSTTGHVVFVDWTTSPTPGTWCHGYRYGFWVLTGGAADNLLHTFNGVPLDDTFILSPEFDSNSAGIVVFTQKQGILGGTWPRFWLYVFDRP